MSFLIHVMGEDAPRSIVCDSPETARHEAALLGIDRRCYTIVTADTSDPPEGCAR